MVCLKGKVICGGIAFGKTFVLSKSAESKKSSDTADSTDELEKAELAVCFVKQTLKECEDRADNETAKEILAIHRMMLEDEDILSSLRDGVKSGLSAKAAVLNTRRHFTRLFEQTGDDYMVARIDDINDICGRLLSYLDGEKMRDLPKSPSVIVSKELLPGDLLGTDKKNIKGIIIGSGTVYSHTAILIKAMGIPALICDDIGKIPDNTEVILDCDGGEIFIEPDNKTADDYSRALNSSDKNGKRSAFANLPLKLLMNIGSAEEIGKALPYKCDGIGLFRTEYIYIGRKELPSEEEQFLIYKEVLTKANGKPVTVRTFDLGSDKTVKSFPLKAEENPALGLRGLRLYFVYPEVFKTQIRALLRSAVYGNLKIMYPMVISNEEVIRLNQTVRDTANELKEQGIPYKLPDIGVMIETPAAAVLSDELAQTADFFR